MQKKKNRSAAMTYSLVLGLAHIYLHNYKKATVFGLGYCVFPIMIFATIEPPHVGEIGILMFMGLVMWMLFYSLIDTEIICNNMGLDYVGDVYEVRIKNYNLALFTSSLISYFIGVGYLICVIVMNIGEINLYYHGIGVAWTIFFVCDFIRFIILKKVPPNNML